MRSFRSIPEPHPHAYKNKIPSPQTRLKFVFDSGNL